MGFKMPNFLKKKITLTMPKMLILLVAVLAFSVSGYAMAYIQQHAVVERFETQEEGEQQEETEEIASDEPVSFEKFLEMQPSGIPRGQIPPGEEDMYIKKSEIVPPVCPKCPDVSVCEKATKCPPCPPCARCPEPAFECKKVPNYSRQASDPYLPRPVVADFSQFAM